MELYSVPGNIYKLDGGAMFGNAPRALWERWMPPDEQNRIRLATRPLLAITRNAVILFEAGIGAYMEPKLKERFGVDEPDHMLLKSLAAKGIAPDDVTHIFLTHLHFDHAGGLLSAWQEGREPDLLFSNARYYVGVAAWERATHPLARDRASFIPELHQKLDQSDRLNLTTPDSKFELDDLMVDFSLSEGHTPGLLCAHLHYDGERMVYASDLVPGRPWVHLPITMGYDRFPELVIEEKTRLMKSLEQDNAWVYYTHDPEMALSRVKFDEEKHTYIPIEARTQLDLGPR
jgi:glyoxylase-like metal-dependent hydrolase (beta-lactamase superfamily II)